MRGVEVITYSKQNGFVAHINPSVDNAYHTALCFTIGATKAHMEAVQTVRTI